MFAKIKAYFKEWNLFEKIFLFCCLVLFITLAIVFNQPVVNTLYSITAIICAFFMAKGKWYGYIFGIICISLYIYISYKNKYYGESIVHLAITLPLYVTAIVNWFRNQTKNKVVKLKKISRNEYIILTAGLAILFAGLYFFLQIFDTQQIIISAAAVTAATFANYLSMRRSDFSFIAYAFDDIFIILLWLIPLCRGDISLLNITITMFVFLINDFYGIINWRRIKKTQKV